MNGRQIYEIIVFSTLVVIGLFNLVNSLQTLSALRTITKLLTKLTSQMPPDDGGV